MRPRLRVDGTARDLHSTAINLRETPADSDGTTSALAAGLEAEVGAAIAASAVSEEAALAASEVVGLAGSGARSATASVNGGRQPAANLPHEHE
jgi:hypothetical protein